MISKKRKLTAIICSFVLFLIIQSCSSDSTGNLIENDTTPPVIKSFTVNDIKNDKIKTPIVISNTIEIDATITDNVEVSNVEIFIDDIKVTNTTKAPFEFDINVSNYESGDHTLKIKAHDAAGNTTLSEVVPFIIDNALPSITDISIKEASIIKGTNKLTFKVSDDNGINNVAVLFDNTPIANITDGNYTIDINTTNITDGKHTLEIIATDSNNNVSKKLINFTSDNSGPKITITAINEGKVISEIIQFSPKVVDDFSEIASFEVLYNNKRIQYFDNGTINSFDFDPKAYATGNGVFKFIAKDTLDNTSELVINTKIEHIQALITLKIPVDHFASNIAKSWVFASKPDGSPINTVKIEAGMTEVTLNSTEAFSAADEFMLTFFDVLTNGVNRISTIKNLTINAPGTMEVPSKNPYSKDSEATYELKNFTANHNIYSEGIDYKGRKLGNTQFKVDYLAPNKTNRMYFYSYNIADPANSYTYQFVNSPVNNGFKVNSTDFDNQNISVKQFTLKDYLPGADLRPVLTIQGFENQNDYTNNVYHQIFNAKLGSSTLGTNKPNDYPLNTNFDAYRHRLVSRNYITERKGTPLTNFEKPNWNVKYNTVTGNTVKITTSGATHNVGRLWLKNKISIGATYDYSWTFVYDSQKNSNEVIIPTLPEALKNLDFYNYSKNTFWQIKQVELTRYDNIVTYEDYINKVIKNNDPYYKTSDFVESVYQVINYKEYPVYLKDLFN
ncbi:MULTISPECIES: Ig-like domain-containing protein [unclassified Tenacibaculum]|uniref:Ig-like domain-containing protein n=1 Tax=unclassified Tenacibaculum TaxID=2635139 RepID=UPI001F1E30EC|nr:MULTISPECIES: Ig-like domain-containing protein [unclassified Tenacibaculum]MCF2875199.1 Ig-like domain-containing protein [Tenacibaculum sp. Cn5-1]MCF2935275.1 Ig-like domain-containing protein [Tenacibaculum sp. Cn5-34]MCG7511283.1 Ig-like domain-containing protein [Tenacibaculum sp. Cn5-46]